MLAKLSEDAPTERAKRAECVRTAYLLVTYYLLSLRGICVFFLLHAWYSHGMRWVFLPTCAHIHTDASKLLKRCPYGASEASGVRSYYSRIIYLVFVYYLRTIHLLLITYLLITYYLLIT